MKIKIKLLPRNVLQEVDVASGSTVSDLLQKLNLKPGAFVVLKNNSPLPVDYVLIDDQELCILQVISGG
jgi:sulfur carrier protein ThiS